MVGWNSTPALWCGKTPQHCGCSSNPALWQLHPLIGVETLNIVWWSCSPTKTVGRNSTPTLLGGSSPRHLRQSADPVELHQTLRGGSPPQQCWVQIQPDKGCNSTPTSRPGVEIPPNSAGWSLGLWLLVSLCQGLYDHSDLPPLPFRNSLRFSTPAAQLKPNTLGWNSTPTSPGGAPPDIVWWSSTPTLCGGALPQTRGVKLHPNIGAPP